MALLNRRLKEKAPEDLPLLEEPEKVVVDLDEEEEDEKEDVFVHHGITLWVSDAVIVTIEQLQIFALLLAMSERWGFPLTFIKASYYVFLVNLDIWEFIKVYSGAYSGFTNTYVASSTIPISYGYYLIAWTVFIALICFGFLGMYCGLLRKRPLYLLLHVARMKRVFCVLAQLMCLPVAIVFARTFHCRYNEKNQLVWNVANEVQCWTMPHYVYVGVAVLIAFLLFLCYPINMIRKIRGQVISYDQGKHEGYLQLKEAEYNQGLDILWAVGQFHLFSSFRRMWVYYRPIIFCLKLALICFFGLLIHFESIFTKSLAERLMVTIPIVAAFFIIVFISVSSSVSKPPITAFRSFVSWFLRKVLMEMFNIFFSVRLNMLALKPVVVMLAFGVYNCQQAGGALGSMFCLLALVMIRTFPFRVASFNIMVIMSLLFNAGNSYIGFLLEQFKHNMVQSSLLAEPYPTYALLLNSAWWLSFLFFWWMYLLLRYYQVVGRGRPLWPMLSTDGKGNMGEETKKYMRAVLHGRHILERALTSPPIFAPVHELERQIHIINAYCREAEYVEDPTFESLWDLLDELIEAHKALAPSSLFSQSVKKTIRETAKEFLKMMPAMRRRLDRRDYDFILMTPLKRRILLKMYVLGTFVNGRSSRLCQEIENKVHMDLEKAAQKSSSSDLADSSLSFMDSFADNKDIYATTDTIGTMSSTGSSFLPGRDSVDRLLYEVGTLEDELQLQEPSTSSDGSDRGKRKKMSVTSLPSIDEQEFARPGSSSSSVSLPGQVDTEDDRQEYPPSYSSQGYFSETGASASYVPPNYAKPDSESPSDEQPGTSGESSGSRTSLNSLEHIRSFGFFEDKAGPNGASAMDTTVSQTSPGSWELEATGSDTSATAQPLSGQAGDEMRGSRSSLRSLNDMGPCGSFSTDPLPGPSGERPNSRTSVRSQSIHGLSGSFPEGPLPGPSGEWPSSRSSIRSQDILEPAGSSAGEPLPGP